MHQLLLSKQPLHRWLHALSQRHGPILHLQLGSIPTLVVSSPDAARLVLHTHDLVFASRSTRSSATRLFSYNYSGLSHTPYGPSWRKVINIERLENFLMYFGTDLFERQ
jgi:cytochrome P450 family 1 subfamily A polypeptide 1/ferulate-5-hydroxylase